MSSKRPHSLMTGSDHKSTIPKSRGTTSASSRITNLQEGIPILNAQACTNADGYGVSTPDRLINWTESQRYQVWQLRHKASLTCLPDLTASPGSEFSAEAMQTWDPKGRYYSLAPVAFGESNSGIDEEELLPTHSNSGQGQRLAEDDHRRPSAYDMSGPYVAIDWRRRGLGVI